MFLLEFRLNWSRRTVDVNIFLLSQKPLSMLFSHHCHVCHIHTEIIDFKNINFDVSTFKF